MNFVSSQGVGKPIHDAPNNATTTPCDRRPPAPHLRPQTKPCTHEQSYDARASSEFSWLQPRRAPVTHQRSRTPRRPLELCFLRGHRILLWFPPTSTNRCNTHSPPSCPLIPEPDSGPYTRPIFDTRHCENFKSWRMK